MSNIKPVPGGFQITRPVCVECGEPPFGDEYCCGHAEIMAITMAKPVRELGCNCCGGYTRGRQWWNRDSGYGMCVECIAYVRKQGMGEDEIREYYGVEGIHWGVDL
jgi:hypothetical protein